MSCDIIQGTNLRNQCEKYNTSCIHRQDGNSCQLKQSQCSTYVSENDCTIATNDQKCVWNSGCVQFTQSSQCSLIKGVNLTNEDCQSYHSNCTVKASKTGCQLAQSQCSSYSTSDQCTFITGNTKCYWNVNTCILITGSTNNCDQIVLTSYSKAECEKYTSCTSDQNNTKCIQKQALCSQGSICGMSATEGNCVLVDNVCVIVSQLKCQYIKGTNFTKEYCRNYDTGCHVNKSKNGCYTLQQTCNNYSDPEQCVVSGNSRCILENTGCQTLLGCDSLNYSKLWVDLENCKVYDCSYNTFASNKACQDKKACESYANGPTYCTYDANYNKCYYDTTSTTCKSIQGAQCSILTGGDKNHTLCNKESSNCTSNMQGDACQELKPKCIDYGSQSECTYSKDEGLCLFSSGLNQCRQLGSGSSCSQRSSLVSKDCHLLSTVCAPKGDGTGCQEKQNRCGYYTSQNDCSLSLFDGWCFWNTKVTPNKCDFVSGISDCTYITGTGLTNDDCQKYNAKCFVNNKGTSCYAQLASCSVNIQDNCNYSENEKGCYWNSGSCKPVTQCSDINSRINLTDQLCDKYKASCISNSNGTACQDKQNTCNLYNSTDGTSNDPLKCSLSNNEGLCYFNSESACQTITASDCSIIINQTNMTDQKCKQYNTACTSNKIGTACQITLRNCKDYTDEDSCTLSVQDGYCYWYTDEERCMQIVAASECSLITGQNLTDEECKLYNSLCTSNRARTACQQQFDNCTNYKTEDSCVYANQQYFCVWDTSDTSCKKISSAAQCKLISYVPNITNSDCKMTLNECRINSDNTGCQEEKPTCSEYNTEIENCTSSAGKKCFKYTTDQTVSCLEISDPTSDCQKVTGTNLTYADCYSYGSGCSVNADKTQCQEVKTNCGDYQQQSECTKALQGYCYWLNSECVKITGEIQLSECLLVAGTNLKHEDCQRYHVDCTSNKAGDSCVELKQDCSSYLTSDECTQTLQNRCFFADSTCLPITQGTDCPSIVDSSKLLTYDICQFYHTSCSVNFDGSACVEIKANCSDYDSTQCYKSSQSECIVNLEGQTSTCIDKSSASNCSSIGINEYTHENCQAIKSDCTINATNDGCTEITCLNYIYTNFDHENCNEWLSECTVNADNDGCIKMPSDCISQTTPCIQSELGRCALINDICTLRTCLQTTQDANFDSDQECSDYLQTCTIANIGGCQSRRSCNQYTTQSTCVLDTQDNKCFWNPTDKNCVDLLCENIEQSSQFNTHDKCYAIDNQILKCTIRELNGQIAQGCKSRGDCNSYLIKEQCVIDKNDKTCVWNTNLTIPACVLKACNTAVLTITTHTECLNYYSDNQVSCTVHAKLNTDQTISLAGCQQTVQCNQYIHKEQCQINQQGKSCGWDGTKCEIKSCYTAPPETDDDQKCKDYFDDTCTVNDSGQGCRIIPDQCEGMTEKQCIKNKNGDPCFWDGSQCITKTCDNAPTTLLTALECNQYLEGCTIDEDVKCKVKPCEEFLYPTDELCKQAMSRCTSNGQYCVERGKCQDASQAGCILSKNNEQCEWVIGQQQSYCAIKSCETAPISLNTDSQCDNYYINCTTKLGGGCIKKSTCNAATVKEACITALDGTKCGWNEDSNQCQNKDCQHFNGTTHQICNQQNQSCTAGLKGKCAKMQECEQTFIKDACIIGLNGPCLWITNYQNLDGTSGACFKQGNCESFQWTTDEQCKLISDQCTTNGTQCVGITLCSETNINGGCKTGTDGQCIQSISSLNSTEQETCKLFTSCSDAYYLTHEQCQKANMNCTTNGLTGCMSLSKCSAYTNKLSCIKNDIGVIQNNNQVTSNGKCQWENETCRDQQCKDLIGLSHQSCQDQLYNCTSNGISCINQDKCALYNNEISCFKGTDGLCFWELATESNNNKGSCRIKKCSDLVDGKTFEQCQVIPQCISDGSVCIQRDKCSTYKTKTACNSGGTEGFCVFKQSTVQNAVIGVGTCSSMTQCTDASNDQVACLQASDRCEWIPNENKCSPHTCESYKSTNFICHSFYDWNKSKLTYCQQINGVCASYDPKTLKQNECFQISEYTYYWNTKSNSCSSCKNTNTTSNTTIIQNLQNTTQTTQGLIETIFILIILMIV